MSTIATQPSHRPANSTAVNGTPAADPATGLGIPAVAGSPRPPGATPVEGTARSGAAEPSGGPPAEVASVDAQLQKAVRQSGHLRRGFYGVVLLVALAGQVTGAMQTLQTPLLLAVPAVAALELGGVVVFANADVRRRLGERAIGSRILSAAIAAGAVTFNWLAHPNRLAGGFFAGMSLLGYLVWLTHAENSRRDRLRALGDLPPTTPAYEIVGHWLRHPWLTRRARSLAKANPALGLYESLAAARDQVRAERRRTAIAKVLHRKIRAAVDPVTADIAVAVYDLDVIADRLADQADLDGLTALIATDLAPARLASPPAAPPHHPRPRWRRTRGTEPVAVPAPPGVTDAPASLTPTTIAPTVTPAPAVTPESATSLEPAQPHLPHPPAGQDSARPLREPSAARQHSTYAQPWTSAAPATQTPQPQQLRLVPAIAPASVTALPLRTDTGASQVEHETPHPDGRPASAAGTDPSPHPLRGWQSDPDRQAQETPAPASPAHTDASGAPTIDPTAAPTGRPGPHNAGPRQETDDAGSGQPTDNTPSVATPNDLVTEAEADDVEASGPDADATIDGGDDEDSVPQETAAAVAYWYQREPDLHPRNIAARIGRSERTVRRYWPPTADPEAGR